MCKTHIRSTAALFSMLAVIGLPDNVAHAQGFPARVVRFIVPTAPGGSVDLVARVLAQKLNESWGYGVVVESRVGAGGTIGVDFVAKAAPDGHTVAFVTSSFTTNAAVYSKLPYDSLRDFAPVTLVVFSPWVLVVNPSLPVRSVKDLVALATAKPAQMNYASTGNGGTIHFAMELFKSMAGINVVHIPYKGTPQGMSDVMGGQLEMTIAGLAAAMPQAAAGKLRMLGVTGAKRSAVLPEVPTIGESVPGYHYENWFGLLVPKATPTNIVTQLHASAVGALQAKDVRQTLLAQGIEPVGTTSAEFSDMIRQEIGKFTKLAKDIGIRLD